MYSNVVTRYIELKATYLNGLLETTKNTIDKVFDELKEFRSRCVLYVEVNNFKECLLIPNPLCSGKNLDKIIKYADDKKANISDKHYDGYRLPSVIDLVVKSFHIYSKEEKLFENTFLGKDEKILKVFFHESNLLVKDGETSSTRTQRMEIMNGFDIDYGRRIDLLVTSEQDYGSDYEIFSVEFRKSNVDETIMIKQQLKKLTNQLLYLNGMHALVNNTDGSITYMNLLGHASYIAQLFKLEDLCVVHKIGNIDIPKPLMELNLFRNSVYSL